MEGRIHYIKIYLVRGELNFVKMLKSWFFLKFDKLPYYLKRKSIAGTTDMDNDSKHLYETKALMIDTKTKESNIDREISSLTLTKGHGSIARNPKFIVDATIIKFIDMSYDYPAQELMQKFLDELEFLTESEIGFFHFIEDDEDTIMLQTWSSNTLQNMCKAEGFDRHYPISKAGIWVDAVRQRRSVVHNDYSNLIHKRGLPKGHAPIYRDLVVPIFRKNKIVALFGVGNKKTPYTKYDVQILETLADSAWETIKRKLMEEEIKQKEKHYSSFIQLSRESIAIYSLLKPMSIFVSEEAKIKWLKENLVLKECNGAFLKLHNFHNPKEVLNKSPYDIFDSETATNKIEAITRSNFFVENREALEILKDGTEHYTLANIASIIDQDLLRSIWVSKIDISENKRIEKEVQHFQRMETLGMVSGGLAHDFNNILSGILGNIELLKINCSTKNIQKSNDFQDSIVNNVIQAVSRGKDITKQLLNYSRKSEHVVKPESLNDIIDSSIKLGLVGSNSKYIVNMEINLPKVFVDRGQIHQVLTNLLINADQSMKSKSGGKIVINVRKISVDSSINMKKGKYVVISVKDQGSGIPPNIQDKLFTPFVTTKEDGLGLGLATSMSIVKSHKGHIEYTTEIGKGTEFKVFIPFSERMVSSESNSPELKALKKGRILLMDDDDSILSVLKIFLEQLGQNVSISTTSSEAITLYKQSLEERNKYDLIILDLIMPGDIGGAGTLKKISLLDSTCKGIICTGSLNKEEYLEYTKFGFVDTFSKPFSFHQLRELLSKWIPMEEKRKENVFEFLN